MMLNQAPTIEQLRGYSSLFSTKNAIRWLSGDLSLIQAKITRHNKTWIDINKSYFDYLKYVYKVLERNYQNEYIFKNAFLNSTLAEEFLKPDVKSFNEFRTGNSVADLAMFNGKSIAFEIKTEMDSCKRLDTQIKSYKEIFNEIYLIIPESKLSVYRCYDVGIIVLESNKQKFRCEKKSPIYTINPNAIMNVLHTLEYKDIVMKHYHSLPKDMNSFNQFKLCGELIRNIPNKKLNKYFISCMKQRSGISDDLLSFKHFKEFKQLGNALKMTKLQYQKMVEKLKLPVREGFYGN